MTKKTVRVLLTAVILGGAFITLLATSMRENAQYFKNVDEVVPYASEWRNKDLKMRGYVVDGSITRRPNTLDYRFQVKYGESVVTADYTGVVPDTFKDGAEVVLDGRLTDAGFAVEDDGITAKCPSKYEEAGPAYKNVQGTAQ